MTRLTRAMATTFAIAIGIAAFAGAARGASLDEGIALKQQHKLAEAERVFAAVVQAEPTNAAALAQWATVLGWLGRYDDSIAAWRRALEQRPDDPDAAMGLARVQYWKGELAPARARVEGLLGKTPDDVDALTLAGDICAAQHDAGCAHARYTRAQQLAPSADLERKLAQSVAPPPTHRLDAGGQLDLYNTARNFEGSFFIQGSWRVWEPLVVSGGYEQLHQFGLVDHRLNLGVYLHPASALLLTARVAISPTANTIAPWEASGSAELRIGGPVTGLLTVRHLDFPNQGVTIIGAGVRVEVWRLSLSAQGGIVYNTIASLQGFGAARIEYAISSDWHVYAGFARGGQAQLLLPPAIATDVTAGITWQLSASWGARLDYTYEVYGDAYIRNSLGTALTWKF